MKLEIEIEQALNLNCDIEYRVRVLGETAETTWAVNKSPGKALDEALLDILLEQRLSDPARL